MTSIIRIKRSGTTAAPSSLASGELAYSWENSTGGKLYIGWGNENIEGEAQNISAIGGLYYTDLVSNRISHTPGTLTANSAIIVDSNSKIDQLKVDDIVIDTNSISTAVANTNLVFVVGGGKSVDVSNAKIINLGTPTANTDAATKLYVDEAVSGLEAGTEFDYAADIGTGKLNLTTEVFSLFGGTGISTVANNAADSITIVLDDTTVVANTYDTTTGVPTFTVDAQGRLTAASTSTTLSAMTQIDVGSLTLSGDSISSITGSIDISGGVITNSGAPTANTDLTTKEYVDSLVTQASADVDLSIAGDSGTGIINLETETFTVAGGTGLSTSVTDNTVTITLDDTGVVANTYGSSTEIPVLTINEQGQITVATSASISTDLSISGDSGSDVVSLLTDTLNIAGGTGVTTSVANNQVEISIGQDVSTTANVTFENVVATNSLEAGDVLISGNTISTTSNTGLVLDATFISVNDTLIKDVADPETPGDAANKRYVDSVAQGLNILPAAKAATTQDLGATYADGPNPLNPGVGATLTIPATATLTIDGITDWSLQDNIIVKDQTNLPENGSYIISQIGDISTPWILTRSTFADESDEVVGDFEFVTYGDVYGATGWVMTVPNANNGVVVGTDDIVWVQFSGAGTYIAGNGLDLTGNVFSVNVDGTSIEIVADTLQVANNGITNAMLAGSIENSKLVNSSITFAANTGTSDPVSLGETITIAGNTGVTTTVSNNEIVISGTFATDTEVGVASFSNTDFVVTNGLVEILPESIQDTVAAFIIGGQSITTSYDDANNALIIAAELASLTNIGVASFGGWADGAQTVRQFAVNNGDVSIAAIDGGTF